MWLIEVMFIKWKSDRLTVMLVFKLITDIPNCSFFHHIWMLCGWHYMLLSLPCPQISFNRDSPHGPKGMIFFSLISDCLLFSLPWSGAADVQVQKNVKGNYSSYSLNSSTFAFLFYITSNNSTSNLESHRVNHCLFPQDKDHFKSIFIISIQLFTLAFNESVQNKPWVSDCLSAFFLTSSVNICPVSVLSSSNSYCTLHLRQQTSPRLSQDTCLVFTRRQE